MSYLLYLDGLYPEGFLSVKGYNGFCAGGCVCKYFNQYMVLNLAMYFQLNKYANNICLVFAVIMCSDLSDPKSAKSIKTILFLDLLCQKAYTD